jgi:regulator of replication initiation timing
MLKILCYIGDRDTFEYIAVSESGRLATRTQNPFKNIPEIEDLERLMKEKLELNPNKEGLAEIVDSIHQYNETVSTYERVRYIKTLTPQLVQSFKEAFATCEVRSHRRQRDNFDTIIDMQLKVVKVERDGE